MYCPSKIYVFPDASVSVLLITLKRMELFINFNFYAENQYKIIIYFQIRTNITIRTNIIRKLFVEFNKSLTN